MEITTGRFAVALGVITALASVARGAWNLSLLANARYLAFANTLAEILGAAILAISAYLMIHFAFALAFNRKPKMPRFPTSDSRVRTSASAVLNTLCWVVVAAIAIWVALPPSRAGSGESPLVLMGLVAASQLLLLGAAAIRVSGQNQTAPK